MMAKKQGKNEVMDPTAKEITNPVASVNNKRNTWGVQTLIDEVMDLFPETVYEVSNYTFFNAGLDVQFHSEDNFDLLAQLLLLVKDDERVADVLVDTDDSYVLVSLHSNLRTQDSRAPFGLSDALLVLDEGGSL